SPSYEFVMHLLNGSKRESVYYIQGSKLILKRKRLLPKTAIEEDLITFKTLSPILLESKEGKPVLATDENFKTEFQYLEHLILKMNRLLPKTAIEEELITFKTLSPILL